MWSALAPARRRASYALLAVAVTIVVVVVVVVGRPDQRPAIAVVQTVPGPVLLVPGYGGSTDALNVLADRLRGAGRDATVVVLPDGGTGDVTAQARTLAAAVDATRTRTGAGSVDVIGYSAGGVVARIWAKDLGGAAVARRIVTLGSPHHGTQLAGLAAGVLPGQCPLACQQLAPGSAVLSALNANGETPAGPRWVSLWTTVDQVVVPPTSARLAGALELTVQAVCPGSTVDHGHLPRDPTVTALVLAELGPGPTVTPGPADCAQYGG